jgi:hypothetical protein
MRSFADHSLVSSAPPKLPVNARALDKAVALQLEEINKAGYGSDKSSTVNRPHILLNVLCILIKDELFLF